MITPNRITTIRFIGAIIGIYLLVTRPEFLWRLSAIVVLILAALTDMWDGWLARKMKKVTNTGKILDPIADKVLTLGVMGAYSYLNLYSPVWVIIIGFREVTVTLVRMVYLKKGRVLAAESLGKLKTISQMVSLSVSCLYLFSRDYFNDLSYWPDWLTGVLNGGNYLFLIIALILTLVSGVSFFNSLRQKS